MVCNLLYENDLRFLLMYVIYNVSFYTVCALFDMLCFKCCESFFIIISSFLNSCTFQGKVLLLRVTVIVCVLSLSLFSSSHSSLSPLLFLEQDLQQLLNVTSSLSQSTTCLHKPPPQHPKHPPATKLLETPRMSQARLLLHKGGDVTPNILRRAMSWMSTLSRDLFQ